MLGKNSIMRKPNSKIKFYLKYETTVNPNLRGDQWVSRIKTQWILSKSQNEQEAEGIGFRWKGLVILFPIRKEHEKPAWGSGAGGTVKVGTVQTQGKL